MTNNYKILTILLAIFVTWQAWEVSRTNKNGAVSSTSKIASDVGIDILKEGGNAFDAIVATGFALAVTSPSNGNIGGGGFLVAHTADGRSVSLDFREKAPQLSYQQMFLNENGDYDRTVALESHKSSGVPGTVNGLLKILNDYGSGKLTLEEILAPAINYAENGFIVNKTTAYSFNAYKDQFGDDDGTKKIFIKENEWTAGDVIVQKDLAKTLRLVAQFGNKGFYQGETAALIVEEMNKNGGLITKQDLLDYDSVYRTPVTGTYRDYTIISMGPPSSGGTLVIQMLNMLENFDLESMNRNSTKFIHLLTETQRLAYADRAIHLGDPDFYKVPIEGLINSNYLENKFKNINPLKKTPSNKIKEGSITYNESNETTHFSIVDKFGNAVSITTTLNGSYGSKVVVDGAGFLLNNEMDDFSVKPGFPNMFGLIGGKANSIEPGKRMLSSMTPTIIEKNNNLFMVLGTPGGSTIITSVFQTILNVIDYEMTMQEAVDAKKIHHQWVPDILYVEKNSINNETKEQLISIGHKINERGSIGRMDCILINSDNKLEGGSDKRGDNIAIGY